MSKISMLGLPLYYNACMEKLIFGAKKMGITLSPSQIEQFSVYCHELIEWNKVMNLTAIITYEDIQIKHFLDSLTVVPALPQTTGGDGLRIVDIGAGAGFPGLPLKIFLPSIRLTLLEATAKKCRFLSHVTDVLKLEGVKIIAGRAEEVAHQPAYRERFDVVLARGVAALPTLAELALPLCVIGGKFIAQKKGEIDQEIALSTKAIKLMGGSLREIRAIEMDEFQDKRRLVVIDKIQKTPREYPRRPGTPSKTPII